MKITIMKPIEVEVSFVNIVVPLRYDDEDSMPKDFPLRVGKFWSVSVEIETGRIVNTSNHASKSEAEAARNRINGEA